MMARDINMVEITVDDTTIMAKEGQSVLQVAREHGIRIPHLCFHPALKPSGSCKLCGVEVASRSGKSVIMLSCILKVKQGLVIQTATEAVQQARVKAFNKLLQMAPDSFRIRQIAADFNVDVIPPADGCIRCRLCIRVCNDVIGARALKMETVGEKRFVMPQPGRCLGCGTCANLCPTRLIHVEDKDGVRTVSIRGETIGKLPLVRCEGCGQMYVTSDFLDHVASATSDHPHVKVEHRFCKTCVKLLSDKTKTANVKTR
ncbi:2Fe-2S iron-sulfur cluster binding domain protein [Desulfamplus magnetovallimortis]|uniref:2Fe-2S iron-sulfur cluster binding domain protein n=1 Tax=Desulfamplus magnetovallimortis TaxID=1246637 RepID=A0A1W1H598_9BACT|nr:2Fe-2S iron-sulfur cluster-binding protein [Desulfamplus magnetovallimortis]SLM27622.1 2Fe-2S iron-sulfur cluster binding domain protein [Desulfamplus magnetovallimortis]